MANHALPQCRNIIICDVCVSVNIYIYIIHVYVQRIKHNVCISTDSINNSSLTRYNNNNCTKAKLAHCSRSPSLNICRYRRGNFT